METKPKIVIGFIDEIHGPPSERKPMSISKAEAQLIADYYVKEIFTIDLGFEDGISGSYEIRMQPYAYERLEALVESQLVDKEYIQAKFDEHEKEYTIRKAEAYQDEE
tara:strand:- start:4295 stop:4618 length:324 start_codon:yes stop_codon:yes gene_type:complete